MVDRVHPFREVLVGECARIVVIGGPHRERGHQDQSRDPFRMRCGVHNRRWPAVAMPGDEHPDGPDGVGHGGHISDTFIDRRDRARPVRQADSALIHHDQTTTISNAIQKRGEDRIAPLHVEM